MLPQNFPAFPDRKEFEIFAESIPATEVGGDFFDFFFIDKDHLCFVIGDVSGKGVPGALFMAVTKTLIKSRAADGISTASILTIVNNELSKSNKTNMFATVFMCILNVQTGELVHTNAGHNPPYILKENKYLVRLNPLHGPVVGPMNGMSYQERKIILDKGDTLLLYTDGVTEAMNPNEDLFSEKNLVELLSSNMNLSPEGLTNKIIMSVKSFEDSAEQADDITVMALQYYGPADGKEPNQLELEIKNQMRELTRVEEQFEKFCKKNQIPDEPRQKVSIVLDELLNNIVIYAFPEDEEDHIIELKFVFTGNRLIVTIHDDGVPFNPFDKDPPDISLSLDERSVGGLGTFLVQSLMEEEDEYLYTRQNGKNVIQLIKVIDME
jgi:sigma-B regulation protein RsbU (phosphoserine phosphatase)